MTVNTIRAALANDSDAVWAILEPVIRAEFAIVGRLPEAFLQPSLGYVDAYVMYRVL